MLQTPDFIALSTASLSISNIGAKLIYIEVFDRIDKPTLTGKLVYPITDKFIVQWESMKELYPEATFGGWIF